MNQPPDAPRAAARVGRGGPGHGAARFVRGFLLAQVCLALSAGAHAVEGAVHLTEGLLFGWLLLSAMCVAAAERRQGIAGIAVVVTLSQVVLHLMMPPAEASAGMAPAAPGPAMIGWHAVAAVLASLLLAHGERLAWALWSLTGLPRVPPDVRPVPAVAGAVRGEGVRRVPNRGRVHAGGATRRGPPAA